MPVVELVGEQAYNRACEHVRKQWNWQVKAPSRDCVRRRVPTQRTSLEESSSKSSSQKLKNGHHLEQGSPCDWDPIHHPKRSPHPSTKCLNYVTSIK